MEDGCQTEHCCKIFTEIHKETVISVKVDLEEYSVEFYLDDKQQGTIIKLKEETFYPAIAYRCGKPLPIGLNVNNLSHRPQYQLLRLV